MKSMFSGLRDRRAFSLVELLLYVGILGIVGGLLTGILTTATKTQVQQTSQDKLSGELSFAMQTIQRLVQSSSLIDMDAGTTSSSLKLRTETLAQDPTLIYLSGGTIYIQQGSSTPQALTDGAVSVASLQFQKFSQYPGKDVVQIDMAMNDANQPTALARSLRSAVSRASAATFDSPLLPGSNTYSIGTTGSPWSSGYFSGTVGIAPGGLLGIGTLTPSYPLDVETANNGIFVSSTATTSNYSLLNLQAGTTTAFYVRNDGNIGIGTSTPAYGLDIYNTLHVSSTATFDGNIVFGGSTSTPIYRISNVATPATSTDVATKGYVDGLTAGGGIPSGYAILGSPTSATPSGYSFTSNLLTANTPYWNKVSSLPYSQYYQASTVGLDGIIYSIGGYVNGSLSSLVFAYNAATDTWTQKASLPYTSFYATAATGPDGLIYLIGGYANGAPTSTVEAYNPSTNSWSKVSSSAPYAALYATATTGSDGLIYLMGGLVNSVATSTVIAYSTSLGTWTTKASLPVATYYGSSVTANGLIYLIGGMSLSSVEVYNPSTNTWTAKATLPYGSSTYSVSSAIGPDQLVYMTGNSSATGTTTVQTYDINKNTWAATTPLPFSVARGTPLVTGSDGLMYSIGGWVNSAATSTVFQYNQTIYKLYTKN